MELYARTGCVIINNDVERPYLKKPKKKPKQKIIYTNLITLKEEILKSKPKSEFFGVDIPEAEDIQDEEGEDEPSEQRI